MLVVYKSAKRGRGRVREPFTPALCTGHRQQDSLSLSHPTKGPRFDFASPESSYVTGASIVADGGLSLMAAHGHDSAQGWRQA